MKTVLADTGPLYALLDPDDNLHSRAQGDLERLRAEGAVVAVPSSTLMEAYSLILYRLGAQEAFRWLSQIDGGVGMIDPQRDDLQGAAARVRRYPDQPITLFDAVLAELADKLSIPVWTFDHHFDVLQVRVWR